MKRNKIQHLQKSGQHTPIEKSGMIQILQGKDVLLVEWGRGYVYQVKTNSTNLIFPTGGKVPLLQLGNHLFFRSVAFMERIYFV